jgi:hypothetical protein
MDPVRFQQIKKQEGIENVRSKNQATIKQIGERMGPGNKT